jgi:CheY-like chemotaxis protein
VLIVEDDEEICASIEELLTDEGYDVSCAANGREALTLLRSTDALPGLILLDLMMPHMDGEQLAAELRRDARLSQLPIVLMTAGGDIAARAAALGARGHLKKPFQDLESLLAMVARFFV